MADVDDPNLLADRRRKESRMIPNIQTIVIALMVIALSGCVYVPTEEQAADSRAINAVSMTCKRPYLLTQDCSIWSGATRTIAIHGFEVKIAGSDAGNIILVMDAHMYKNTLLSNPFVLNLPRHSRATNNSFRAVSLVLAERDVEIIEVIPVTSFGNIDGYVIRVEGEGYGILQGYGVDG
jgi:hypothetical protein